MIYTTEDKAITRVLTLRQYGYWPGYYQVPEGWRLMFDPPDPAVKPSVWWHEQ